MKILALNPEQSYFLRYWDANLNKSFSPTDLADYKDKLRLPIILQSLVSSGIFIIKDNKFELSALGNKAIESMLMFDELDAILGKNSEFRTNYIQY